jgi:hypothetical protein
MKSEKALVLEVAAGLLFVVTGFILWWWSTHLVWIQIYPPPLEKTIIESLPLVFWTIGILLVADGFRRKVRKKPNKVSSKED